MPKQFSVLFRASPCFSVLLRARRKVLRAIPCWGSSFPCFSMSLSLHLCAIPCTSGEGPGALSQFVSGWVLGSPGTRPTKLRSGSRGNSPIKLGVIRKNLATRGPGGAPQAPKRPKRDKPKDPMRKSLMLKCDYYFFPSRPSACVRRPRRAEASSARMPAPPSH